MRGDVRKAAAERDAPTPVAEVLCRTCLRPITHETRIEDGRFQREGWYDDASTDAIVCFKARDYRHVPLTARERAYYDAGAKAERERIARALEADHEGCSCEVCETYQDAARIARTVDQ